MKLRNGISSLHTQPKQLGGLAYWSAVCPMINCDLEYVEGFN